MNNLTIKPIWSSTYDRTYDRTNSINIVKKEIDKYKNDYEYLTEIDECLDKCKNENKLIQHTEKLIEILQFTNIKFIWFDKEDIDTSIHNVSIKIEYCKNIIELNMKINHNTITDNIYDLFSCIVNDVCICKIKNKPIYEIYDKIQKCQLELINMDIVNQVNLNQDSNIIKIDELYKILIYCVSN